MNYASAAMRRFTSEKKVNADVLACIVGGIFLPNMEVSWEEVY
jgi:hypothetical protein